MLKVPDTWKHATILSPYITNQSLSLCRVGKQYRRNRINLKPTTSVQLTHEVSEEFVLQLLDSDSIT